jgi:hypothetical protein
VISVIMHLFIRVVIQHIIAYILVSICVTVMCNMAVAVKTHVVRHESMRSGGCTVPVLCSTHHSDELVKPSMHTIAGHDIST